MQIDAEVWNVQPSFNYLQPPFTSTIRVPCESVLWIRRNPRLAPQSASIFPANENWLLKL